MTEKQKPAHKVELGRIRAAVWANSTKKGLRYNVTFTRSYLAEQKTPDAKSDWKESTSFGREDLPLVSKAADLAYAWIENKNSEAAEG